jgi:hypothetical protein
MLKQELIEKIATSKSVAIPMWLKRERTDILDFVKEQTKSYVTKSVMEQIYIILHGEPPKCGCGNYRIFNTFEKGYRIGCNLGNKCIDVALNRTTKQKNTLLETYGVTNASKLESVKEKTKQTNLEKYGVEHHSQHESIKEKTKLSRKNKDKNQQLLKTKQTNLKKYGVDHHMKLKTQQDKVKKTNKEIYNVEFPLQNKNSVEKMKSSWKTNNKINEVNEKRKVTTLEKYGVDAISRINLSELSKEILFNKNNFVNFVENKTRTQVLNELNIHEHTLYLYAKKYSATNLFKRPLTSEFEKQVAEYLKNLNLEFTQNDRSVITPNELDFFIPSHNLAIECCGLYWHSENSANRNKNYHFDKFNKCKEKQITLITIFQDEWDNNKEKIKDRIKFFASNDKEKVYARNTVLKEVPTNEAKEFIQKYHIQDYANSSIKLGLYHNNQLCSIMTFGKSRFKKDFGYEMIRYCSNKNVIGGSKKLLSYFIKTYDPKVITSYSDNRFFNGTMYKSLGFNEESVNIGYFYTDYHKRFNRLQFQKHKLVEQGHDNNKSEWEIMQQLGYDRIFDCGQTTWVLNLDK